MGGFSFSGASAMKVLAHADAIHSFLCHGMTVNRSTTVA
jgi:hypothetical protein